jgi:hypothetical protein
VQNGSSLSTISEISEAAKGNGSHIHTIGTLFHFLMCVFYSLPAAEKALRLVSARGNDLPHEMPLLIYFPPILT